MAIHIGGTFDYKISVKEDKAKPKTKWTGKGRTTRHWIVHPGLLGYAPDFELSEGLITLHSTEPKYIRWMTKHFINNDPSASASFEVGNALNIAIRGGDRLHLHRSFTGDLGFSLIRSDKLVLAMGAIAGASLGSGAEVREDPRLREFRGLQALYEHTPRDLQVTVLIQNRAFDLHEGQEVIVDSYYVFVERAYRVGMPGQQSILSIAKLSEELTKETVISCTKRFTNPDKMMTLWEQDREPARKRWQVWR